MKADILEITQLADGDVVLREPDGDKEFVRIRFSAGVRDMLGPDVLGVAEAMIDAASEFLEDAGELPTEDFESEEPIVVH